MRGLIVHTNIKDLCVDSLEKHLKPTREYKTTEGTQGREVGFHPANNRVHTDSIDRFILMFYWFPHPTTTTTGATRGEVHPADMRVMTSFIWIARTDPHMPSSTLIHPYTPLYTLIHPYSIPVK